MPNFLEKVFKEFNEIEDAPERGTFDTFPGVREPEAGYDFIPDSGDMDAVAVKDYDLLELLAEIARNTSYLRQNDGVVWQQLFRQLPTTSGELSLIGNEYVGNLYIPNVPRAMRIYEGSSRGLFLGSLVAGQTLIVDLPYKTNGVYIEFDEGETNEQVNVFLSSKPIHIDILPGGAVWG